MVGDVKEESIRTRLIFASGRPLKNMTDRGLFRKDLFFRLQSGHSLELTSLRNDINRIKEACQFFSLENGVSFSQNLIEFYQTFAWPGNLRQLLGHLEKKKVLTRSKRFEFDQFDEELLLQSSDLMNLDQSLEIISMEQLKSSYIKRALSMCEGNINLAAKRLKISEKTVRAILQKD